VITETEVTTSTAVAAAHLDARRRCPIWITDFLRTAVHSPDLSARVIAEALAVLSRIDAEAVPE
jgi:hypothetical protein